MSGVLIVATDAVSGLEWARAFTAEGAPSIVSVVLPPDLASDAYFAPDVILVEPDALDQIPNGVITERFPGVPLFPLVSRGTGFEELLRAIRGRDEPPDAGVRAPTAPAPSAGTGGASRPISDDG